MMRVLQIDSNHPILKETLEQAGFSVDDDFSSSYQEVLDKIARYDGLIIRSRLPIDAHFLEKSSHLKFIARVGAGMENIDVEKARSLNISLINSPEGNRDAVAEHVVGMLLLLMHRLKIASIEVENGEWIREGNRGDELLGKCVGLIGYGFMGKATAKRLSGFGVKVIFHDLIPGLSDEYAQQVSLDELFRQAEVISLHVPLTKLTHYLVDQKFIDAVENPFYLVNTARGLNVKTKDLVEGLRSGKIKGAALDVLEYEKSSFENLSNNNEDLQFLIDSDQVILTPHIAGWTLQSKIKLASVIASKIIKAFS